MGMSWRIIDENKLDVYLPEGTFANSPVEIEMVESDFAVEVDRVAKTAKEGTHIWFVEGTETE